MHHDPGTPRTHGTPTRKLAGDDVVLVIGGTGGTGSLVVRRLLGLATDVPTVRVMSRSGDQATVRAALGEAVEVHRGDVADAAAVDEAMQGLLTMRSTEGAALEAVLRRHVVELEEAIEHVRVSAPAESERILARLADRVRELCARSEVEPDPERVAQELALLAARGDVAEELDRIDSHVAQMRSVLDQEAGRGQGKALDFLVHEPRRAVITGDRMAPAAEQLSPWNA